MAELNIDIAGLKLKNPVLTASGTFGYGAEFDDFYDVSTLGGFVVKGTTLHSRQGNAYPRMAETPSGMLNAVGLQNGGVKYFVDHIYPGLLKYNTHVLVNVSGSTVEEYITCAEIINELEHITGIELNISCPNVKEGGMAFGTSCPAAEAVVKEVRKVYHKHLMVKLSPNVTDIAEIAKAVEGKGADSISLINTILAMAIHAESRKPVLSTITGGLSGPAIKPIALRMVWQVYHAVKVPVIGMGGIMNATDAIEFFLAGSSAIQVGTANFIDPLATQQIISGINDYLDRHKFKSVKDLVGCLQL
ncbi:MAG TPA: dihydroorotate dehydrogenase [Prolixibacteraceae bacterium]|nr:dihydroorotate dehydrogenase [Prolixibacteraceae bacterium]